MDNNQQTAQATPKRIVIVEDNTDLAEIYKTQLEAAGYICFVAYNGITGLYYIQKEIPDLVLLDLMVPDIAGDQIILRMRSSTWGKNIPVYIISNLNEEDAPKGLRELGIAGYSVKANISDGQLEQIVHDVLFPITLNQPTEQPEQPENAGVAGEVVPPPPEPNTNI